jgi:hypothetical protein
MGLLEPAPHALPWNVLALLIVGFELFNLRTIHQRYSVTVPAGSDIGNRGDRATLDRDVAIHARELHFANVDIVRKGDGLLCVRLIAKKVRYRLGNRRMGRRENLCLC